MQNNAPKFQRHLHNVSTIAARQDMLADDSSRLNKQYLVEIHKPFIGATEEPNDAVFKTLEAAHNTLILMFDHCPEILVMVIQLLEETLRGDSVPLRTIATKTMGAMFGSPQGSVIVGHHTLAEYYRTTWHVWLGRKADKVVRVRLAWIDAARDVLANHPELRDDVEGKSSFIHL